MKFTLFQRGGAHWVTSLKPIKRLLLWAEILGLLMIAGNTFGAVELQTLMSFGPASGHYPTGPLIKGKNGDFYGTTSTDEAPQGNGVFKINSSGKFSSVASLTEDIGIAPGEGLALGADGNFYGTATRGGPGNFGTIFKMTPNGKLTAFASFDGTNGWAPVCLITGTDGNFYGASSFGGGPGDTNAAFGHGTIFKLTPGGELTALFAFAGTNGDMPMALIQGMDGNLYGMTAHGGSMYYDTNGSTGYGTVFQLTTNGTMTTLCEFDGTNSSSPQALVQGSDGNLYGTTYWGGTNFNGTIFRLTTTGDLTTLHEFGAFDFSDQNADGAHPVGRLFQGKDGCIYGGTRSGGTNSLSLHPGLGTFFKMTTNGVFFTLASLGQSPSSLLTGPMPNGLIQDRKGNFLGTTYNGGTNNMGSVVKLVVAPPILAITKHQRAGSSDSVTVSGKTKAKLGGTITHVFYQLNDGDWTDASTTDDFAHWTADVTLTPGMNIFRVYAFDSAGDNSRTNILKLRGK